MKWTEELKNEARALRAAATEQQRRECAIYWSAFHRRLLVVSHQSDWHNKFALERAPLAAE